MRHNNVIMVLGVGGELFLKIFVFYSFWNPYCPFHCVEDSFPHAGIIQREETSMEEDIADQC